MPVKGVDEEKMLENKCNYGGSPLRHSIQPNTHPFVHPEIDLVSLKTCLFIHPSTNAFSFQNIHPSIDPSVFTSSHSSNTHQSFRPGTREQNYNPEPPRGTKTVYDQGYLALQCLTAVWRSNSNALTHAVRY